MPQKKIADNATEEKVAAQKKAAGTSGAQKKSAVTSGAQKKAAGTVAAAKNTQEKAAKNTQKTAQKTAKNTQKTGENTMKNEPKIAAKGAAKKILFCVSEALPFAGTGGLGEIAGSLPAAVSRLKKGAYDIRVMMPYYKETIAAQYRDEFKFVGYVNVQLSWRTLYAGVFKYEQGGITYYFIDNEYYFKRHGLYGFFDDGERFAYFSRACLGVLDLIGFIPDVIHAHDWQTALVPIYFKLEYKYNREGFQNVKTVFTIHNVEYQGKFGRDCIEDLFGIPRAELHSVEFGGAINLMRGAMDYSDMVTTVSPTYAKELMSAEYAHGLEQIAQANAYKMTGILNGIDYESYDPQADPALFAPYSAGDLSGKEVNKIELQKMLGLPVNADIPLVAVISRLVTHKGIDLLKGIINDILKENVQLVVLGKGDADFENYFAYIANFYDTKFKAIIAYNKDMSRKIYAAADIFLMPSKSEPCGLAQMIACRYGTVPIVRETGGLYDSIRDCNDGKTGNGFSFSKYTCGDLAHTISRALGLYFDYKDIWKDLRARIMEEDFSWSRSAKEYDKLYQELTKQ